MLQLVLKARLPLIKVTTTDTLNMVEVLRYLSGKPIVAVSSASVQTVQKHKFLLTQKVASNLDLRDLYAACVEVDGFVVFVNPDSETPLVFDAGEIPTPKEMVMSMLGEVADEETIEIIMPALGGLTLKDVGELVRLCQANSGGLTSSTVVEMRRVLMSSLQGLTPVNTRLGYHFADTTLLDWAALNESWFKNPPDVRLQPRGLLLHGASGTGKTQGAKMLATLWGIPLYRLDMGGAMSKYVGESERNLQVALRQIEVEEPCVLLLDEVEKVFTKEEDSGVSTRMLGSLLWWLQEHRSKVLTVMTTNGISKLPEELYRPGRVDASIKMKGLDLSNAELFISQLFDTLAVEVPEGVAGFAAGLQADSFGMYTQAQLTWAVYDYVKTIMGEGQ